MLRIAVERKLLDVDQQTFADMVGVSKSTVSRWERGELMPYGTELIKMREVCGCSIDWLLGVSDIRTTV